MATVSAVLTNIATQDGSVVQSKWTSLTNTNVDGSPISFCEWADRCVSVDGTFGGATVTVQGSNDGTNWYTLNNAQGTAATFTAAGIKQIVELPKFMRPLLSGGSGADVTVYAILRRNNPMRT